MFCYNLRIAGVGEFTGNKIQPISFSHKFVRGELLNTGQKTINAEQEILNYIEARNIELTKDNFSKVVNSLESHLLYEGKKYFPTDFDFWLTKVQTNKIEEVQTAPNTIQQY